MGIDSEIYNVSYVELSLNSNLDNFLISKTIALGDVVPIFCLNWLMCCNHAVVMLVGTIDVLSGDLYTYFVMREQN